MCLHVLFVCLCECMPVSVGVHQCPCISVCLCVCLLVRCDKCSPMKALSSSPLLLASHPVTRDKGRQRPSTHIYTHDHLLMLSLWLVCLKLEYCSFLYGRQSQLLNRVNWGLDRGKPAEAPGTSNYLFTMMFYHSKKENQGRKVGDTQMWNHWLIIKYLFCCAVYAEA